MLVNSSAVNSISAPAYPSSPATSKPLTGITTRADMTGDPEIDGPRGFPTLLMLTKSDISLIKDVTGVNIDYETGKTMPESFESSKVNFINAIADKRTEEFFSHTPKNDLSSASLKDIFKQAAAQNHPLDISLLNKALTDMFPSDKKSGGSSPGQNFDTYA